MRYIVIGGSGFLGSCLVNELKKHDGEVIVCDLVNPNIEGVAFQKVDISQRDELRNIGFEKEDIIINLAANQYHHKVPRKNRKDFFENVNVIGTKNILEEMALNDVNKMVYFSTDMVYGKPEYLPVDTDHIKNPFGPYGHSKKKSEMLCEQYRNQGFNISIFRPRMIIGPGRLGILKKLFFLMKHNLPVPLIGDGHNHYQMISVFDCTSAIMAAIEHGIPNGEYNLGSKNPPTVYNLLSGLIEQINSKSKLIKTNGSLVKGTLSMMAGVGLELMYKEQYMIADENYLLDVSKTENELDWTPEFTDDAMVLEAYKYYINELGR